MGLEEILNEIEKDGSENVSETIKAAKLKSARILMEKQSELDKIYEKKRHHLNGEIERLEKKLKAKSELDVKREITRMRGKLINYFLENSREALFDYFRKNSKAYENFLEKAVKSSLSKFGESPILLSLSPKDTKYFEQLKTKFGEKIKKGNELENQSGVICRYDRRIEDWTLESLFEKSKAGMISLIDEELKKLRS